MPYIDHSFDIFGPVVRLTNTDKDGQDNNYMYQTVPFMWQRKRDREVCCFFGDHGVSCFTTSEALCP